MNKTVWLTQERHIRPKNATCGDPNCHTEPLFCHTNCEDLNLHVAYVAFFSIFPGILESKRRGREREKAEKVEKPNISEKKEKTFGFATRRFKSLFEIATSGSNGFFKKCHTATKTPHERLEKATSGGVH